MALAILFQEGEVAPQINIPMGRYIMNRQGKRSDKSNMIYPAVQVILEDLRNLHKTTASQWFVAEALFSRGLWRKR